jgi:hypothetical protein
MLSKILGITRSRTSGGSVCTSGEVLNLLPYPQVKLEVEQASAEETLAGPKQDYTKRATEPRGPKA